MNQNHVFRSLPIRARVTTELKSPVSQAITFGNEQAITEKFEMLETLGHGGFGTVVKAISKVDQSPCAIKVIPRLDRNGRKRHNAITNEINILKDLDHPAITAFLGEHHTSQTSYIILEYAEGGNLEHFLNRFKVPEQQIKYWILDLAEALEYLHENKVIHRDVKPANILLTNDGKIQLTDFGLATRTPHGVASGKCGTPYARAPEILEKTNYTYAVDWWSLGVVFYEMVTGKRPFKPSKQINSEEKVLEQKLIIPSSVSPHCASLINDLLEKDVNLRLQSLNKFYDADFFKDLETP